jgi:hypothetical protein
VVLFLTHYTHPASPGKPDRYRLTQRKHRTVHSPREGGLFWSADRLASCLTRRGRTLVLQPLKGNSCCPARVPRPSVVFVDSLAAARITAPGFLPRMSRKSTSNQEQQGLSERVPRRSVVPLAFSRLRSYNRSLLPPRKALKILCPTSAEPSSARWFFLPSFTRTLCVQESVF